LGQLAQFHVSAEAYALDTNREPPIATTEDGDVCPLDTSTIFEWLALSDAEAVSASLNWDAVLAILVHENELCFRQDGTDVSEMEHRYRMLLGLDLLRHVGYLGWLGCLPFLWESLGVDASENVNFVCFTGRFGTRKRCGQLKGSLVDRIEVVSRTLKCGGVVN